MQPLDSSFLEAAAYDDSLTLLELDFRNGAVYLFAEVPDETYQELLQAESKGRYFISHIRDRFPYARMVAGRDAPHR